MNHSIQSRLTAWISATIVVIALPGGVTSFVSAFQEANELQDDYLRQVASLIDSHSLSIVQSEVDVSDPDAKLIVQALGTASLLSGQRAAPLALPADLPGGLQTLSVNGESWRLYVVSLKAGYRVAIGQKTEGRDETAKDAALRTLVPMLALLPLLLVMIGMVVRGMLRPMTRLGTEVDARSEYDLRPLSVNNVPNETRPFIESINRLLQRLESAIESQARFIADAAHELRSPMTALVVQAENVGNSGSDSSMQERLVQLKAGLDRFGHLLEQLLSMARTQSHESRLPQSIPIGRILRRVIEDLIPISDSRSVEITVDQPSENCAIQIGETDGIAVIKNIVDNAIRFSPNGGNIEIRVDSTDDLIQIEVIDSGPGLPSSEMTRVFDPFYRSPGTQTSGSGLGLAIAKNVLDRLGGTIALSNAAGIGKGLRVLMSFPRAPHEASNLRSSLHRPD